MKKVGILLLKNSRAPDVSFFESLVDHFKKYSNVNGDEISLYGISNGSGLVNNLLISSSEKNIVRAVTEVSQLNIKQYHRHKFWKQGDSNKYEESTIPIQGRKIMS